MNFYCSYLAKAGCWFPIFAAACEERDKIKKILEALEKIPKCHICWKNPSDTNTTDQPVVKFLIFNQPG